MTSGESRLDLEAIFELQYERIARVIARVLRDPARAEELAVEVFLKLSRRKKVQGDSAQAWLYRVAVRAGLDELRRESRRMRREQLLAFGRKPPTPEEIHVSNQEQERVRAVLEAIPARDAELLILRSDGLSYDELASALSLRPSSIGTFLNRAGQTFRKEYVKRYGQQ